jgi:hypothetical protein
MAITWQLNRTAAEPSLRDNPFDMHPQEQELSLFATHKGWEATIVPESDGTRNWYRVTIRNVLGVTRKRCRYSTETEAMMVAENMLYNFGGT